MADAWTELWQRHLERWQLRAAGLGDGRAEYSARRWLSGEHGLAEDEDGDWITAGSAAGLLAAVEAAEREGLIVRAE